MAFQVGLFFRCVRNVIAILNNFHPFTGLGKYAFSLFREISKKMDAELLYLESKENRLQETETGIKKIAQPFSFPVWNKTLSWYYYFPPRIPQGYELYHCTSQYLARVAKFRKPTIISHFDLAPLVFPKEYPVHLRFFLKKALEYYKEAATIHVSSEKRRQEILDFAGKGIQEENIFFVPAGIDEKVFFPEEKEKARKELGLPMEKKIVLNVGSEEARKNIPAVVKAVEAVQESNKDVMLVRVGNRNPDYDGIKKSIGIKHFSGIPEEKLRLFYSAADVFVFPTLYEGFGYPVLEAMACGCPTITTDELDVFKDGCIIVEKENQEQLVESTRKLLESESLTKKQSKKAFQASKKFSLKKEALEIMEMYGRAMQ